jgi:glycosyltransferase involved in cell wall biosynthesis
MKILALTKYSQLGASSRLRVFQYLDYLRERGDQITVSPLLTDNYLQGLYTGHRAKWPQILGGYVRRVRELAAASETFDLIWMEKELFPWLPALLEQLFRSKRVPCVVDYDDAIFHSYENHSSGAVRLLLKRKIEWVMARADCVVVGNEYLASRARRAGAKQIKHLPTVVDLARYSVTPSPMNTPFTIGWIGTPITAGQNLPMVASALREVCKQVRAEFMTVGSGTIDLGFPIRTVPWHENTEVESIGNFHVGIMPLIDEPFQRGKCGYKLIQCMAVGRPVIGSPVGANSQIIQHGVNGFLAKTTEEWIEALLRLSGNAKLLQKMSIAARKTVESQYSTQITAPRLASIFDEVVEERFLPSREMAYTC